MLDDLGEWDGKPAGARDITAPAPIVFAQIADGAGYQTQFILLSRAKGASVTLNLHDDNGSPLAIGKAPH